MKSSPRLIDLEVLAQFISMVSSRVKLQKGFYISSDEIVQELLTEVVQLNRSISQKVRHWIEKKVKEIQRKAWRETKREQRYVLRLQCNHKLRRFAG